jgi:hypothetical protein
VVDGKLDETLPKLNLVNLGVQEADVKRHVEKTLTGRTRVSMTEMEEAVV